MDQKLIKYLDDLGVKYKVHEHPAVFTVEESKALVKGLPGLHMKNLFLKDDKGRYYLVCMVAEDRLNIKNLKDYLAVGKLSFASPEELKKELNLTPGSVSIFGMIYSKSVKLLLDEKAWKSDLISFHPNVNTATLELNHTNFKKFYDSLSSEKEIVKLE